MWHTHFHALPLPIVTGNLTVITTFNLTSSYPYPPGIPYPYHNPLSNIPHIHVLF